MIPARLLRIAAVCEVGSLAVLLVNLLTVHTRVITSITGPVHGISYLTVIVLASMQIYGGARWQAFIPGIGGLLAVRQLRSRPQSTEEAPTQKEG